ncbi:ras-responsive element-binding protein 1 [Scleropages formosus]|uniref:Ras responsive element binding protein 1 n=2 Tax=Scleropages formosus TaxID=113540 RepID=A0A8C9SI45_SCLFO|nr:ras-responsive element-binding protein 1-like [Scleropages formosus]
MEKLGGEAQLEEADKESAKDREIITSLSVDRIGKNGDAKEERGDREEEEGKVDTADLSSINTIMSTVMNAGHLDQGPPSTTNAKAAARSAGRRNQSPNQPEAKEQQWTFTCPLCEKNCQTQHQLTMHIRQHNLDNGTTDHSCSICGKSLSSASSLDRHMLVHSGERPYRCSVCSQTFTTNGNMHRHMKIHDKDLSGASSSPPSPTKRRRSSTKRKSSLEADGERRDEPPCKKMEEASADQQDSTRSNDAQLPCPICFRTFACKYNLEAHMETHPDASFRCDLCCVTFRTHRGLLRHNASIHKVLPTDRAGNPFIQNNPSIPLGFSELAFIDFSCHKFPQIAQVWCETNLRRCSGKFHRFVCEVCNKAFPLQTALNLHMTTHGDPKEPEPKDSVNQLSQDSSADTEKLGFMASLGLQPVSLMKPVPSEDEVWQAQMERIRVIRVQPTKSDLPQEACLPQLDPASQHKLSVQPFQKGPILQPDSGLVVNPICSEGGMELADIQQILKVASNQITLSPSAKGHCNVANSGHKQMPQLKPKPLVAPRNSMAASTPPPLTSGHQALPGSISPNLPPIASHLVKNPGDSSPTTSSSNSTSMETVQMEADCMGDALTPMDADQIKQEEEEGREAGSTGTPKVGERKTTYPCRFCSQSFALPGVLQAHVRYHLGIAAHRCNICNYVAPEKATLIRHLRTHSGERPYICRTCSCPFTVKANCEGHLGKKHMTNSRTDSEKNIEYVSAGTENAVDPPDCGSSGTLYQCYGEDLKKYQASQVHLHSHNGCLHKVYECRQCGTLFIAKSACIQHLLEKHTEVQEREIEEHITTILVGTASQPSGLPQNGLVSSHCPDLIKVEERCASDPDEPLDFSHKSRGVSKSQSLDGIEGIKPEGLHSPQLLNNCSVQPIDLSVSKSPVGNVKQSSDTVSLGPATNEIKKEPAFSRNVNVLRKQELQGKCEAGKPAEENLCRSTPCHRSLSATSPLNGIPAGTARATRLKPLLPKPDLSSLKELPPLASIAQIISSVSAASDLLKRDSIVNSLGKMTASIGLQADSDKAGTQPLVVESNHEPSKESTTDKSNKRGRKKSNRSKERPNNNLTNSSSRIDLESSGEFASVEKMLATTAANKFSPYLSDPMVLAKEEAKEDQDNRQQNRHQVQQPKGKKNAYSNSVQKMNCPFCPRVFPWASSLQRHMLTHTGQKPYPCPNCDAVFSTKSNCERHLLRKHGVANRAMRRNGAITKPKDADEGSPESAESMSESELPPAEPADLVGAESAKETADPPEPFPEEVKLPETKQLPQNGETEDGHSQEGAESADSNVMDDDSQSNQSLDLDFASKLIDFRFSESNQQQSPAQGSVAPEEPKHSCRSCKKSFRFAATLARHEMVHVHESHAEAGRSARFQTPEDSHNANSPPEERPGEEERSHERNTGCEAMGSGADSGSEEEEREQEGKSDEDSRATEPRSSEAGRGPAAGNKADKRKKICSMCGKRFWSLQDLTRHTRSHTGEKPYKCQTCERTFTLKHSLVRHQRIHQKPRDGDSEGVRPHGDPDEEGARGHSSSESESAVCGAGPATKNEREAARDGGEGSLATVHVGEGQRVEPPAELPPEPTGSSVQDSPGKYIPSVEPVLATSEAPLVGAE